MSRTYHDANMTSRGTEAV